VVSIFASASGRYDYITVARPRVAGVWHSPAVSVEPAADDRVRITAEFDRAGAGLVVFGG